MDGTSIPEIIEQVDAEFWATSEGLKEALIAKSQQLVQICHHETQQLLEIFQPGEGKTRDQAKKRSEEKAWDQAQKKSGEKTLSSNSSSTSKLISEVFEIVTSGTNSCCEVETCPRFEPSYFTQINGNVNNIGTLNLFFGGSSDTNRSTSGNSGGDQPSGNGVQVDGDDNMEDNGLIINAIPIYLDTGEANAQLTCKGHINRDICRDWTQFYGGINILFRRQAPAPSIGEDENTLHYTRSTCWPGRLVFCDNESGSNVTDLIPWRDAKDQITRARLLLHQSPPPSVVAQRGSDSSSSSNSFDIEVPNFPVHSFTDPR